LLASGNQFVSGVREMDARQMKKHILAIALRAFLNKGSHYYELALVLDKDPSQAQLTRWKDTLQKMVENAESKLK
jgi:hypothetical protein